MDTNKLKNDLIVDEGLKLFPYKCTAGKITIGVGRNIQDIGITKAEAMFMLDTDIDRVELELDCNIDWWRNVSEYRQRALANMCFNMGIKRLLGFKNMLLAMKQGDFNKAADEALNSNWAKQVGDRAKRIADMIRKG